MKELFDYLNENPSMFYLFFLFALLWNAAFCYFGGKKAEAVFTGLNLNDARFRERGASGFSKKSIITKFGGARKVLDVIVTESELCIKGIYSPLTYIGSKYDMTRRVELSNIRRIIEKGPNIELSFHVGNDVVLQFKDKFIKAIKGPASHSTASQKNT